MATRPGMRPAVQTQRRPAGRMSRSKIFCLTSVIGVTVRLVFDKLSTEAVLAPGAFDAAISVSDTGAQAAEDLTVLGPPFPDSVGSKLA